MAYRDFSLSELEEQFQVQIIEEKKVFSAVHLVESSEFLQEHLDRNLALALAINTEKARSEFIIIRTSGVLCDSS
ncbi:MAG: hypothetical protein AB4041_12305 [Microcystaceae cyanobacterium]